MVWSIDRSGIQWWRDLFRCRIDLLNFSMGFNIIAPYMEFLHLNRYFAEWIVNGLFYDHAWWINLSHMDGQKSWNTKLHEVLLLGQWGWSQEKCCMLNVSVYFSETYMKTCTPAFLNCLSTWRKRLTSPIILAVTVVVWVAWYNLQAFSYLKREWITELVRHGSDMAQGDVSLLGRKL